MKKYKPIIKTRREYFGGLIFREKPAFVAHVNSAYADAYGISKNENAILKDGVFSAPLDAHIAITTRCNMFCRGCYNSDECDTPADMPLEMAKDIIDKLSELGVFSLSFGGGEPTLHPQIFEIAEYSREKQVLPNMTTNGLTMTYEFAKKCAVFGNIHLSVHKPQDMEHIPPAIRNYRKATGKRPGINLLLSTETMPHLNEIVSTVKKAGVRIILFLRYKTTAKNAHIKGLSVDNEINKIPEKLRQLHKLNRRLMFLYDCSLFEVLAENDFANVRTCRTHDNNGCVGGNSIIAIDVNGMYKPCSFWHEPFGDTAALTFDNWVNNDKHKNFRNTMKREECLCCEYLHLCHGGCRLQNNTF
ncbi:MAG: radical SAM protein [Clostridiales bacterium]|jgi:radical SAM protein with 4Fe4S-binding SPASM domain|nr:radical SAM protein [Clostridiales bacterium]